MMKARTALPRRQHGVSLVEVLVTMVVISIGLLGLAALQATGLNTNTSAYLRTQATNLAYEMLDEARANRSTVLATGTLPDTAAWNARAAQVLPSGVVAIVVITAPPAAEVQVTVTWADERVADPAQALITFQTITRI